MASQTKEQKAEHKARKEVTGSYPLTKAAAAVVLLQAGEVDREFFIDLLTGFLAAARTSVAVAVEKMLATVYLLEPVGFVPRDYSERDRASLETVLGDGQAATTSVRVQTFVSATLDQATRDFQIELGKIHGATHWTWTVLNRSEACDDCLAKDGNIFPIDSYMFDHPHCECYPQMQF